MHVGQRIPLTLGNCVHTHNKEVKKILTLKTFFGDGGPGGGGGGGGGGRGGGGGGTTKLCST